MVRIEIYIHTQTYSHQDLDYLEVLIYSIILNKDKDTEVNISYKFDRPIAKWLTNYGSKHNAKINRLNSRKEIPHNDKLICLMYKSLVLRDLTELYQIKLTPEKPVACSYKLFDDFIKAPSEVELYNFPSVILDKVFLGCYT